LYDRRWDVQIRRRAAAACRRQRDQPQSDRRELVLGGEDGMRKATRGMRIFQAFNIVFLGLVGCITIIPVVNVWAKSFSGASAILNGKVFLWPIEFTLSNYEYVIHNDTIWRAFMISVLLASVGTLINLAMTS